MDVARIFQEAIAAHRAGNTASAEALYRTIVARDSGHDPATFLLSTIELERGRTSEAIRLLRAAISKSPRHPAYHSNLGEALRREGRCPLALAAFDRALELAPQLGEVHFNRGLALEALDRLPEALGAFERAVRQKPELRGAWHRLARTAWETGDMDRALELYRQALERFPEAPELHNGLGSVLKDTGRVDLALPYLQRAAALAPDNCAFHSSLVCALSFHPEYSDALILEEARKFDARHAARVAPLRARVDERSDPERKLRVGYIGPTFSDHIIGRLLEPLFRHHDRERYEIYCYSDVRFPDPRTLRLRDLVHAFREIRGVNDAGVAELVRNDAIDVLVDVNMHMTDGRLLVFARRPAPVQACWIAYPGTTGLSAMDYRISDPYLDPPGTDANYAERTVRLPHGFWCYDALNENPPAVGPLPALSAGHVTFGHLNNFCKLNTRVLRVWARVLRAVPSARLLVMSQSEAGRRWMRQELEALGVDPGRLEFVGFQPRSAYLETYGRIDIGLDGFPYNGHTTSLDSFFMGVPVVTLSGATVAGRAGSCLARNLRLSELIAHDEDEYVRIALELAQDRERLAALRRELRARMLASPLMDGPRFARDFEGLLRGMWREHLRSVCVSEAPPEAEAAQNRPCSTAP